MASASCSGWDPEYRPETAKAEADIVTLGYVINVIEDPDEQAATLRVAWSLCRQVLAVSAQVLLSGRGKNPVEFGDRVLTGRGTFYLFKDEARRQQFLANRFRRREIPPRRRIAELRLEETRQALEPLMDAVASLGRLPDPDEFAGATAVIERFGSLKRAFAAIQRISESASWEAIARRL